MAGSNPGSSSKLSLQLERPRSLMNMLRHLKLRHNSDYHPTQSESGYNEWFRSRRVCAECQEVFQYWYLRADWSSKRYPHQHHSLDSLEKSAESCPICELLVSSLDGKVVDEVSSGDRASRGTISVNALQMDNNATHEVHLVFKTTARGEDSRATVHVFPTVNPQHHQVGRVNRSTSCDQSWNLAKRWLEECITSHTQCNTPIMQRKLPSRLISVDSNAPKLVHVSELPSLTRYLTLSHCWGTKAFVTLTQNTLTKFRKKLPFDKLSKTFQQAIIATRKLGYHYLWIDALCIIQDTPEDFRHETAHMGNIYANSDLNIAAAGSPDGETGLFINRSDVQVLGWKVECGKDSGSFKTESWDCTPECWRAGTFANSWLSSRAWVFQERLLAPRTLYFGAREIAWECRTIGCSETFPDSVQDNIATLPAIAIQTSSIIAAIPDITSDWFEIVTGYSAGKLTYPKDKLVAISGAARLFAQRFGSTYLAGLWSQDLLRQLTWCADPNDQGIGGELPFNFRAPSWSWASIDKHVFLHPHVLNGQCDPCVTVEEVNMNPVEDPFVDFKGGFLRVRYERLACGSILPSNQEMSVFGRRIYGSVVYLDFPYLGHAPHVFYLPLVIATVEKDEPWLVGMVLNEIDSKSFSRIGMFVVTGDQNVKMFQGTRYSKGCEEDHRFAEKAATDEVGRVISVVKII